MATIIGTGRPFRLISEQGRTLDVCKSCGKFLSKKCGLIELEQPGTFYHGCIEYCTNPVCELYDKAIYG